MARAAKSFARRSKYGNIRTVVDGIKFASKAEANRYLVLKEKQRRGEISKLEMQPKFPITLKGRPICNYLADFRYCEGDETVIEDVKGMKTAIYRLKKKLTEAEYGIKITEIQA